MRLALLCLLLAACGEREIGLQHPCGAGPVRDYPANATDYAIDRDVAAPAMPVEGYTVTADAAGDLTLELRVTETRTVGSYEEFWGSIFFEGATTACAGDQPDLRIDFNVLADEIRGATSKTITFPARGRTAAFDLYIDDFVPAFGDVMMNTGGRPLSPSAHPFAAHAK